MLWSFDDIICVGCLAFAGWMVQCLCVTNLDVYIVPCHAHRLGLRLLHVRPLLKCTLQPVSILLLRLHTLLPLTQKLTQHIYMLFSYLQHRQPNYSQRAFMLSRSSHTATKTQHFGSDEIDTYGLLWSPLSPLHRLRIQTSSTPWSSVSSNRSQISSIRGSCFRVYPDSTKIKNYRNAWVCPSLDGYFVYLQAHMFAFVALSTKARRE
jgi:hypothetical protein